MSRFPAANGFAPRPTKPHVILLTANGAKLLLERDSPPARAFVHSGRLWVFNETFSQEAGQPVFHQMTHQLVADMRQSAAEVMQLAAKFEFDLKQLEAQAPAAKSITDC